MKITKSFYFVAGMVLLSIVYVAIVSVFHHDKNENHAEVMGKSLVPEVYMSK